MPADHQQLFIHNGDFKKNFQKQTYKIWLSCPSIWEDLFAASSTNSIMFTRTSLFVGL